MIGRIARWLQFRRRAKDLRFPLKIRGYYTYATGIEIGRKRWLAWMEFAKKNSLDARVFHPIYANGDVVATYRLLRVYEDRQNYRSRSDLADGDSGLVGDFKLARMDEIKT